MSVYVVNTLFVFVTFSFWGEYIHGGDKAKDSFFLHTKKEKTLIFTDQLNKRERERERVHLYMIRGIIQTLFCPHSVFKNKMSSCCPEIESVEDTEERQDAIFALGYVKSEAIQYVHTHTHTISTDDFGALMLNSLALGV